MNPHLHVICLRSATALGGLGHPLHGLVAQSGQIGGRFLPQCSDLGRGHQREDVPRAGHAFRPELVPKVLVRGVHGRRLRRQLDDGLAEVQLGLRVAHFEGEQLLQLQVLVHMEREALFRSCSEAAVERLSRTEQWLSLLYCLTEMRSRAARNRNLGSIVSYFDKNVSRRITYWRTMSTFMPNYG